MALIPTNNPKALISYYLGFLSLLPVVGLLAAVPGLILGVQGVREAARLPDYEGHGHAIVGIVLCVIGLVIGLSCLGFLGIGLLIGAV